MGNENVLEGKCMIVDQRHLEAGGRKEKEEDEGGEKGRKETS